MAMIAERIARLKACIAKICQKQDRDPADVTLVGVTKFADTAAIREALAAGITHIGENRVQEARRKFALLKDEGSRFQTHMIGHLQTNKVKDALKIFDMIQSVDSLRLAERIEQQARSLKRTVDVLLQVNTSGEEQKFGISPDDCPPLVAKIAQFSSLRVRGLMTIAPLTAEEKIIRKAFRDLKTLYDTLAREYAQDGRVMMQHLSMGMTHDYAIALEEGATMVRIGSAIFKED